MCKTFSAIVLKSGDLIFDPATDSHEDLIESANLSDLRCEFARVEFVPKDGKFDDLNSYIFKLDEFRTPDWWTEDIEKRTVVIMRSRIDRMIVREDKRILIGGNWILSENINIEKLVNCRIIYAGSATIQYAQSATIQNAGSARIHNAGSARIQDAGCATIQYAQSAMIQYAGFAMIEYAESATIHNAQSAMIRYARFATIEDAGYATILT